MQWILRNRMYYVVFTLIFFMFWFLFKVGGIINIGHALLSTLVDVVMGLTALLVTVEVLLPAMVYKNRYAPFFAIYILLLLLCGTVIIFSQLWLDGTSILEYGINVARSPKHFFYWFWADLIFGSYFMVFFISSAGAAIKFAFDRMQAHNMVERLQKEKLSAELDLLKNQVNPHFLFNALNTIFYKIDRTNQPARDTLEQFSKMLRYQLYECNTAFVAIEKEMEFIASYIALQKERLNENYTVKTTGFDEVRGVVISPFLLMPVIENCFKHVSSNSNKKNEISIECGISDNVFTLHASNTVDEKPVTLKGGIGLDNLQKRLQLMYVGKHDLKITRQNDEYDVLLKITTA